MTASGAGRPTGRRRSRALAAAVATLAALAGCASNGTDTASDGSTSASPAGASSSADAGQAGSAGGDRPSSSTASTAAGAGANGPATTTYPATTAGGGSAPKTTRDPLKPIAIPNESACAPGPGPLPDGLYFGFMGGASADALEFDLACWFTGEPANAAAAADGEESPPPNDYYIRNTNETLRREPVASGSIPVAWIADFGNPATTDITYTQWLSERDFGQTYTPPVWITVKDGAVVDIVEQWLP